MQLKRAHLAALFLLLGASSVPRWVDRRPDAGEVELVYLANEGFLVRSSERAFVIDAFLETPLGQYAALPPALHAKLASAEAPFVNVDLALVSHVHPDHFQAASARAFLAASHETELATSPQVIASLEEVLDDGEPSEAIRERLHSFLPEAGETLAFEHRDIEVAFLRLPHSGNRPAIQNLGHLIQFEGRTILHVGDAEGDAALYEPYGLGEVEIDVALLPYWYWSSPAGRRLVRDQLSAETLVAVHVPPREVPGLVDGLAEAEADVHVFREPLERLLID